jgi:hypothetical protein
MTEFLEQSIAKLKTRPISEQDSLVENLPSEITAMILEEIKLLEQKESQIEILSAF